MISKSTIRVCHTHASGLRPKSLATFYRVFSPLGAVPCTTTQRRPALNPTTAMPVGHEYDPDAQKGEIAGDYSLEQVGSPRCPATPILMFFTLLKSHRPPGRARDIVTMEKPADLDVGVKFFNCRL